MVGVEADGADAEGRAGFVGERAAHEDARHGGVQVGRVERPEPRLRHRGLLREGAAGAGGEAVIGGYRGYFMAGGIFDRGDQLDRRFGGGLVDHGGLDRDQGLRVADHRRVYIGLAVNRVDRRRDGEPHMAVDAAAGVKARIGRRRVVHAHGHHIGGGAEIEVGCQLVFERRVAVGPVAEEVAIDPHVAIAVDAVEGQEDPAAAQRFVELERLAIPADAARQEAGSAGVRSAIGPFDGPIVRQIQSAPGAIVGGGLFRARGVAQVELPAVVEIAAFPDGRGAPHRQRGGQQGKREEWSGGQQCAPWSSSTRIGDERRARGRGLDCTPRPCAMKPRPWAAPGASGRSARCSPSSADCWRREAAHRTGGVSRFRPGS